MPWCPSCRTEYRAGFRKCADCGAVLVNVLPPEPPPEPSPVLDESPSNTYRWTKAAYGVNTPL